MKLSLNTQIFIAAILGILIGLFLFKLGPDSAVTSQTIYYCGLIGKIFISLLKMILIPLVFTSITVGIANLRAHAQMKKVWRLSLLYYFSTTALAVILGLIAVNIFKPGVGLEMTMFQDTIDQSTFKASLTVPQFVENFLGNLFVNPIQAMANGMIIPTIMFALFLGIALIVAGDKAKTTLKLMSELYELIMTMVNWIMKILPIGILVLLIQLVATQKGNFFESLGHFILVVIGTTLFHGFVTLPCLLVIFGKYRLSTYYKGVSEALITALSTSSSAATLPITTRCVEENLKVDKDVAGFVLPLGATINMDGTALYEAMAALFIANLAGIDLNIVQQCLVFLMAILASVGAPGIPSAGMVTMVMVLQAVGLPVEAIAILIPIDRLLDSVRTMVNVKGDTIGSIIVDQHT